MKEQSKMTCEEFLNLKYPIILNEKNGKFTVFVPQLSLFAEGESLQRAYDVLMSEKKAYYSRLEAVDSLHLIPKLSGSTTFWQRLDLQKIVFERLVSFSLTSLFWILFIFVFAHQVTKAIHKAEVAFLPAEEGKSEERFLRFQEKMKVISPYVKEFKKAFKDENE